MRNATILYTRFLHIIKTSPLLRTLQLASPARLICFLGARRMKSFSLSLGRGTSTRFRTSLFNSEMVLLSSILFVIVLTSSDKKTLKKAFLGIVHEKKGTSLLSFTAVFYIRTPSICRHIHAGRMITCSGTELTKKGQIIIVRFVNKFLYNPLKSGMHDLRNRSHKDCK